MRIQSRSFVGLIGNWFHAFFISYHLPSTAVEHERPVVAYVGDTVITSGIDGIYPKGIPVGVVVKAEQGPNLFKNIEVRPSVDFGTIEEVIVIHTRKIPSEVVRYAP